MASESVGLWATLGSPSIVALVGGGGKTTLAFCLAAEAMTAGRRALVTTTTHMHVPEAPRDVEEVVFCSDLENAQDLLRAAWASGRRSLALASTTEKSPHGLRAVGIPADWAPALLGLGLADLVVVEADGSRMLPFKAPRAPREPVIPAGAEVVLAIAGVDCLDSALEEVSVCRADVVAEVAGVALGALVTPEIVGRVLGNRSLWCHSLQGVAEPRFYAVVNKVVDHSNNKQQSTTISNNQQ